MAPRIANPLLGYLETWSWERHEYLTDNYPGSTRRADRSGLVGKPLATKHTVVSTKSEAWTLGGDAGCSAAD